MDEKDELPDEEAKKLSGLVPDIVRRAVLTGVGALFMTEEGIRNMVTDMKLPKDALAFLLSQADKTRTEVARVVTQEMRRFLESETLRREIWKLLTGVTLEVKATIQLKPSGEPGIKAKVRSKKKAEEEKSKNSVRRSGTSGCNRRYGSLPPCAVIAIRSLRKDHQTLHRG